MPDYTRGSSRDVLSFVKTNPIFCYGWKTVDLAARTGLSSSDITTQLGHMTAAAADAVPNRIMVTGANSPKPARVVKRDITAPISSPGSTSTFIAYDKLSTAATAGWTLAKAARGVRLTANVDGRRSVTAIAELSNGALYAFPMNRADFELFKAPLGLVDAASITTDTERRSLVTGSRSRPGKVSIEQGGGMFSSYFATAAETTALTAGFNIDRPEYIEFDVAAPVGP